MNVDLLNKLRIITEEEALILKGSTDIQKNLYTSHKDFIVDSEKMLSKGELIDIRPHTRFVHFPPHKHNFIEIIYMCIGSTTHIVNKNTTIELKTGDLLFLNQNATQEILPADINDIAINFIVLPEFFDSSFGMMQEDNVLKDFFISSLTGKSIVDYIHFQTHDILPIQNLLENMIWYLLNKEPNMRNINKHTMGLLLLQLLNYADRINQNHPNQFEQQLLFTSLKYIEENYKTATLNELSITLGKPTYYISKLIKKHSKRTFKDLLQIKRLTEATSFLINSSIPIEDIISIVGYENSSYFHKIFKKHYHMSPKTYRDKKKQ